MINTRKIKSRMCELGLTQKDVANALHIAQPTANQKINNIYKKQKICPKYLK